MIDVGGVGMRLLWCDFEVFLHHLCHHQMAGNDLVCLVGVYLMFAISCEISSAGGCKKSLSRSKSIGVLADMVMTSSGLCDTRIQSNLM